MSTDIQESTESHTSSSNIFSNFSRDLLNVIRTAINQYHADYNDQIKVLADRVIHLEESQEKWITSTKKLMEEYQSDVLKRFDDGIEAFTTTIQSLQSVVQNLETETGKSQQIKEELIAYVEELRKKIVILFKITDQLVNDMNQLEVKQEELGKEFSTMSDEIRAKKKRFFSWFSG